MGGTPVVRISALPPPPSSTTSPSPPSTARTSPACRGCASRTGRSARKRVPHHPPGGAARRFSDSANSAPHPETSPRTHIHTPKVTNHPLANHSPSATANAGREGERMYIAQGNNRRPVITTPSTKPSSETFRGSSGGRREETGRLQVRNPYHAVKGPPTIPIADRHVAFAASTAVKPR
jgi:hypothetical protein